MARQKGIIKVEGSLEGLSFYSVKGKDVVRRAYGPSRERISNEKNFQRTRENNKEFSGAASAGKALRAGLAMLFKKMSDSYCTGRLLRLCKQIMSEAEGIRGQRPFLPLLYKDALLNFRFHEQHSFGTFFYVPYVIAVNNARTCATLSIPAFNTNEFIKAVEGATHIKVINLISVLSAYRYNAAINNYEEMDTENNTRNAFSASEYLPLEEAMTTELTLTGTLSDSMALAPDSALVICIAIEFYQVVGEKMYLLQSGGVMKVAGVF